MTEKKSPYKQVRIEEAITDIQQKQSLAALDKPWHPERARFRMASGLAFGLLVLFGLTIACSGIVFTILLIISAIPGTEGASPANAIDQMIQFFASMIPYIATPLGVALGYFFKESQGE